MATLTNLFNDFENKIIDKLSKQICDEIDNDVIKILMSKRVRSPKQIAKIKKIY